MDIFENNNIPWMNLKGTLFHTCKVMRGKLSGAETRIRREKAPHLLDIDGYSCHHVHNCAKKFTKSFGNYLPDLFKNLYSDFKLSSLRTLNNMIVRRFKMSQWGNLN